MKLSVTAMELCADKFGKGKLYGFDHKSSAETITQEEAAHIYDELVQSEMIVISEEGVHISALGQHILHMMITPEQYIMLENKVLDLNMKLYFKDAYYLCLLENKAGSGKFTVDLLPGLKEVVSAFVFALYREDQSPAEQKDDIHVTARAWNKDRISVSEMEIHGSYLDGNIRYSLNEISKTSSEETNGLMCPVSEFVNNLTKWLFARLSETMAERGN